MSVSTDGILCFGVDLGDEPPEWFEAAQDEYGDLPEEWPVEVVRHCADECPMYILAAQGTVAVAWRGDPVQVSLEIAPKAEAALREFLKQHDVVEEPRWLLASMWS